MRWSRYFLPLLKETPADAQIISHQLMLRAGMIRQSSAGIYSWLPLGLRVLSRVEQTVREEMNAAGAHVVLMPAIQPASVLVRPQSAMKSGIRAGKLAIGRMASTSRAASRKINLEEDMAGYGTARRG